MLNKNAALTTIGTSMGQEICLILGQVSHSVLCWKRNLQTDFCGPVGETGKTAVNICGQSSGHKKREEMLS